MNRKVIGFFLVLCFVFLSETKRNLHDNYESKNLNAKKCKFSEKAPKIRRGKSLSIEKTVAGPINSSLHNYNKETKANDNSHGFSLLLRKDIYQPFSFQRVSSGLVVKTDQILSDDSDYISMPSGKCCICKRGFASGEIACAYFKNDSTLINLNEYLQLKNVKSCAFHTACPSLAYKIQNGAKISHLLDSLILHFSPLEDFYYVGSFKCEEFLQRAKNIDQKLVGGGDVRSSLSELFVEYEHSVAHPGFYPCVVCAQTSAILVKFADFLPTAILVQLLREYPLPNLDATLLVLFTFPSRNRDQFFFRNVNMSLIDANSAGSLATNYPINEMTGTFLHPDDYDELVETKMEFLKRVESSASIAFTPEKEKTYYDEFFAKLNASIVSLNTSQRQIVHREVLRYASEFLKSVWVKNCQENVVQFICALSLDEIHMLMLGEKSVTYNICIFLSVIKDTSLRESLVLFALYNFEYVTHVKEFSELVETIDVNKLNFDKILSKKSITKAIVLIIAFLQNPDKKQAKKSIEHVLRYFEIEGKRSLNYDKQFLISISPDHEDEIRKLGISLPKINR